MCFSLCAAVRRQSILAVVLLCLAVTSSHANTQTFFYTGAVTDVPTQLSGSFNVGDPISGSYSFDTTVAPSVAGDGSKTYHSVSDFNIDVGGFQATMSSVSLGDISVVNDIGGEDRYSVVGLSAGTTTSGFSPQLHALQLTDSGGSAFSGDALPVLPFNPSVFDSPLITLDFGDGANLVRLEGELLTLQVPEPNGLLLLGGMGLLAAARHRRRR